MLVRIMSGAVLLLLLGSAMIMGGWFLYAVCLAISLIGLYELYRAFRLNNTLLGLTGYAGTLGLYICIGSSRFMLVSMVLSAVVMAMMAVYVFTFPKYTVKDVALAYLGFIYTALLLSFIYQTRLFEGGIYYVWLIFICAWGSDSFAYLTGVAFGKHKMSPVLSPKKSIEGAVGGIVCAALLGALYGWFVQTRLPGRYLVVFALAGAVGALISMVGDLAASAIKRNYELKDYGKLIPGHGGVMDRFDSVIFTAPVVYWVLYFCLR